MLTFIVYLICGLCGWVNLLLARVSQKVYFPIRSYLIAFNESDIANLNKISRSIYNFAGYKAIIHTIIPYKIIDDIFFVLISSALITLFLLGYSLVKTEKISQSEIIKWSFIFSILMTFAIPSHSSDLFGYIARGAQQSLHGLNPYMHTVSEIKNYHFNPLFFNFTWPSQPTTYGPLFIHITKLIVQLSNNNLFIAFINFKLFNLIFYLLLVLFLINKCSTKDLYLISWNPLILIQGLWNCHNDLLSGILIFIGLYLLIQKVKPTTHNLFFGIFCLTVASGIKYVSLIIIPIVLFHILKNKPEKQTLLNLILGFFCGFILLVIFSIDYFTPFQSFANANLDKITVNINLVHKSFIDAIFTAFKYLVHYFNLNCDLKVSLNIIKYSVYILFLSFYIYVFSKPRRNLAKDVVLILFVFFAFTIAKFHSWYLLNVVLLIPLLDKSLLKTAILVLSLSHVYAITFLDQAKILNFISMTLLPFLFVYASREKNGKL